MAGTVLVMELWGLKHVWEMAPQTQEKFKAALTAALSSHIPGGMARKQLLGE